jgi:nucleotide-binding universal stress UspA family protein
MTTSHTRHILAPVDFGEASAHAVTAAGAVARFWPADLELLHAEALEAPAYFTHEQVEALAAQRRRLQSQAEQFLERFGRQHTSSPFTTTIEQQPPLDAILHHAKTADLIVMGTHGRRGPSRWWLGSVAEGVLHAIDRPLVVVHARDEPREMFSRVHVYAEPPLAGEEALALARSLAGPFASEIADRRRDPLTAAAARAATLLVVAAPRPGDRAWLETIGDPLIRAGAGAVLFVPEAPGG